MSPSQGGMVGEFFLINIQTYKIVVAPLQNLKNLANEAAKGNDDVAWFSNEAPEFCHSFCRVLQWLHCTALSVQAQTGALDENN